MMSSLGVLYQNRTARKGVYTNALVDVRRSGCYSWRKLHESGRLVLAYSWMLCVAYNLESNKGEITMTENEAIRDLEYLIEEYSAYPPETGVNETIGSLQYCITALREIQQYREIGTVEECREAIEKQKPKKRIYPKTALERYYHAPECPNCKRELKPRICGYTLSQAIGIYSYCPWCGQNLEGGEESEGE